MPEAADRETSGERETRERQAFMAFLSRLAHDIRGPVGVTGGALDELGARLELAPEDGAFLLMARRGLRRVLRIVDRLSMIAEIEDELELERRPIAVGDLLREAVDEAQALNGRKTIQVVVEADPGMTVYGDPRWIGAIVMEIVSNAIRHAKKEVRVTAHANDDVMIVVDDDGPGFSPSVRLEDFQRLKGVTSQGGTGLGASLSIARDVLQAHGGQLSIVPRRDERGGARVSVRLPSRSR